MQIIPHIPVLFSQVLETFSGVEDGIIIDCTMGYGGHSSMILEANPHVTLIGIDQDQTAIDFSTKRLEQYKDRVEIKKGRFSSVIKDILKEHDIENIKGILADIGVSSLQLDQKDRGFSYDSDKLDMRMDKDSPLSALEVVNEYSTTELERILLEYGELRNYKKIASFIVDNRPFNSAKELSDTLKPMMPHGKKIHPATLLMQAIRIEVNDELGELKSLLKTIEDAKFPNAKVAIISFHSLEDRIVKQTFSDWKKNCICPDEAMRCTCTNDNSLGRVITKKPIMAKNDELKENIRSRSAKMRVFKMVKNSE
ncbi:16S rRNA (cytosine(1402)-N(4))-methyltransferase RsmH [Candidatus Sulfurimonas marisnigri]|uniref:Ribosomal RNA small subunit methyltransferase H n=1 Tax=Candidatus Sulfurimonas marisnigri TaxID=2740405 RepID=A0A7S7M2S8_9BACT|nr:16S rRNA (cytosine(1402)-N(4))-methyltransferase RsmH [Candidatus Sulfurimonas marisnigri]QOY55548.1 16S rRNA (cytosine(1402)-N(4))-methyltransferase RsmH [Candidatus Sulfurimonas marisnigri]